MFLKRISNKNVLIMNLKVYIQEKYIHLFMYKICIVFIAALFAINQTWKLPKCPSIGEWIRGLRC